MRNIWGLVALSVVLALGSACHKGKNQNSTDVRVVNSVAASAPIDILIDGDVKLAGVAYGVTSSFAEFGSGDHELVVRNTTTQTVLYDKTMSFGSGATTTLVVYGNPAAVGVLQLDDSTTSPSSSANFKIRTVDGSPDAAAVDVFVTQANDISSAPATFSGALYGAASGFAEAPAGNYNIFVTIAGTKDILYQTTSTIALAANTDYTFVVVPSGGGKLANGVLYAQGSNGTGTYLPNTFGRVKAVNGVPDSVGLTFKVDGTPVLSAVPFAGNSSYVSALAGSRTISVEASNVPGVSLTSTQLQINPARDYTIAAVNALAQVSLVAFVDDNTLPGAGLAKIRFGNLEVGSTNVDVLLNFANQVSALPYATVSSYYSVGPSLTYTISFTSAGGVTVIATLSPVELDAGGVYTAYLVGTPSAPRIVLSRDR